MILLFRRLLGREIGVGCPLGLARAHRHGCGCFRLVFDGPFDWRAGLDGEHFGPGLARRFDGWRGLLSVFFTPRLVDGRGLRHFADDRVHLGSTWHVGDADGGKHLRDFVACLVSTLILCWRLQLHAIHEA
jgi:hypothetical protein